MHGQARGDMITQAHGRLLLTEPVPQNVCGTYSLGSGAPASLRIRATRNKIPAGWFHLVEHSNWISTRAIVWHARTELHAASQLPIAAWMGGCMASAQLLACILCLVLSAGFFFLANSRSRTIYGVVPNFPTNTTYTREPAPLLQSAPAETQPRVEPPARNCSAKSDSRLIMETSGIRLNSRGRRSRYSTFSCTGPQLHEYLPSRFTGAQYLFVCTYCSSSH